MADGGNIQKLDVAEKVVKDTIQSANDAWDRFAPEQQASIQSRDSWIQGYVAGVLLLAFAQAGDADKVRRVRAEALRLCESANAIGADGRGIDAFRLAQRDELRDYARAILDIVGASDESANIGSVPSQERK